MNYLPEIAVILLAAVTHATLQLGLGALLLLYHASLGKHIKPKTKGLVGSFIAGFGLLTLFLLGACCFTMEALVDSKIGAEWLMALVGILVALAICVMTFYYRNGKTTELWLPKAVARHVSERAKKTESNSEAFSLGMLASFAELPISLALLVVAANSILALPESCYGLAIACYTVIAVLPLVIMRLAIRRGKTVVDVQRWRIKNKTFLRIVSSASFLVLAMFLIAFKVLTENGMIGK